MEPCRSSLNGYKKRRLEWMGFMKEIRTVISLPLQIRNFRACLTHTYTPPNLQGTCIFISSQMLQQKQHKDEKQRSI